MQITIDTRHDNYTTALAVLRRAYGRTGPRSKTQRDNDKPEGAAQGEPGTAVDEDAPRPRTGNSAKDAAGVASSTRKAAPSQRSAAGKTPRRTSKGTARSKAAGKRPSASSKTATITGGPANVAPPGMSEVIRTWATEQGLTVSDRGRLPAHVIASYRDAHPQSER
ncbi:MAG: Lsr2 family DNA-binding protein [Nocardioidaceae bacterium]